MIPVAPKPKRVPRSNGRTEPLENGERLTAREILRRYEAMPRVKKAELIEGVVYLGTPVRYSVHGRPDALVQLWLGDIECRPAQPRAQDLCRGTGCQEVRSSQNAELTPSPPHVR